MSMVSADGSHFSKSLFFRNVIPHGYVFNGHSGITYWYMPRHMSHIDFWQRLNKSPGPLKHWSINAWFEMKHKLNSMLAYVPTVFCILIYLLAWTQWLIFNLRVYEIQWQNFDIYHGFSYYVSLVGIIIAKRSLRKIHYSSFFNCCHKIRVLCLFEWKEMSEVGERMGM